MKLEAQDWTQAADHLESKVTEFKADVAAGFAKVDRQVEDQFRDEQLSGRHADDTGLNIRTGRLHDSIKSVVDVANDQIMATVYNTDAPYWEYHQDGAGHNPKRLFFEEYFTSQGLAAYTEVVEAALVEVFA